MPVSVDDVLIRVAAAIKTEGPEALQPWWYDVASAALASAVADIRGGLLNRGFTLLQLDGWDGLDAYTSDQALFWALVNGAGTEAFDDRFLKLLDRREALKTAIVTEVNDKGETVAVKSGSVGHGVLRSKSETFRDELGEWKRW